MDAIALATALEKFASYVDANEGARVRETRVQTTARVEKVAEQYRSALGDAFSPEIARKLAGLDADTLALVEKLAAANAAPASLGGPASAGSPFVSAPADPVAEFTRAYTGSAR